jgi:hypothetical protein
MKKRCKGRRKEAKHKAEMGHVKERQQMKQRTKPHKMELETTKLQTRDLHLASRITKCTVQIQKERNRHTRRCRQFFCALHFSNSQTLEQIGLKHS